MQSASNPMANKFSHDREAIPLDMLLNCSRYVAKTVTNTSVTYSGFKSGSSRLQKLLYGVVNLSNRKGHRSVTIKSVIHYTKIQTDNIPVLNNALVRGDTVDDFVIQRDTNMGRERNGTVPNRISFECGFCPLFYNPFFRDAINRSS